MPFAASSPRRNNRGSAIRAAASVVALFITLALAAVLAAALLSADGCSSAAPSAARNAIARGGEPNRHFWLLSPAAPLRKEHREARAMRSEPLARA